MTEAGKKKGRWQGHAARDFQDFQNAVKEILNEQEQGSTWIVETEVRKVGNPVHDYRIVLSPTA